MCDHILGNPVAKSGTPRLTKMSTESIPGPGNTSDGGELREAKRDVTGRGTAADAARTLLDFQLALSVSSLNRSYSRAEKNHIISPQREPAKATRRTNFSKLPLGVSEVPLKLEGLALPIFKRFTILTIFCSGQTR